MLLTGLLAFPPLAHAEPSRPLRVDDLFARERLEVPRYSYAPDGKTIIYLRIRARQGLRDMAIGARLFANGTANSHGADIWLQRGDEGAPVNLTHGESDGSSWFAPIWSPDGARLAMLSTRGGGLTLWLWERATGELRRLSERTVDDTMLDREGFRWVDNDRLVVGLKPLGFGPDPNITAHQIAERGWTAQDRGEVSVSVLQSGISGSVATQPWSRLTLIDTASGKVGAIAPPLPCFDVTMTPAGQAVAMRFSLSYPGPRMGDKMTFALSGAPGKHMLRLFGLDGREVMFKWGEIVDVLPGVRWSRDGQKVAFFARTGKGDDGIGLYVADLVVGQIFRARSAGLTITPESELDWTPDGIVMLRAVAAASTRLDWWRLDSAGPKILTSALADVPGDVWSPDNGVHFAGLAADGELYRFSSDGKDGVNLTRAFQPNVESWMPRLATLAGGPATIVLSYGGSAARYALLDPLSGAVKALPKPEPSASIKVGAPRAGGFSALFLAESDAGHRIWQRGPVGKPRVIASVGAGKLSDVSPGRFMPIVHKSADNRPVNSWLLLPPDQKAGRRYPLMVVVYPGRVYRTTPPAEENIAAGDALNMQIAAAQGYAVLFVSMPGTGHTKVNGPMPSLADEVLPAVNAAVSTHLVDGERLFLFGHSFGGYAVNSLVTQSSRFKAAIASAGVSDVTSKYLALGDRYAADPAMPLITAGTGNSNEFYYYEEGQGALGVAPWTRPDRYLHNSPVYFADKIQTPLMLIHGDLDGNVPIAQSEEMFQTLYRQGKRAEFVRYLGEGHIYWSPVNIRDMWSRIFAWLDEYGDIARGADGALIWDGDHAKGREGAIARKPEEYLQMSRMFEQMAKP